MEKVPDYQNYSLEELLDAYSHINQGKWPERAKVLQEQIELRRQELAELKKDSPQSDEISTIENEREYSRKTFIAKVVLFTAIFPIVLGSYVIYQSKRPLTSFDHSTGNITEIDRIKSRVFIPRSLKFVDSYRLIFQMAEGDEIFYIPNNYKDLHVRIWNDLKNTNNVKVYFYRDIFSDTNDNEVVQIQTPSAIIFDISKMREDHFEKGLVIFLSGCFYLTFGVFLKKFIKRNENPRPIWEAPPQ